MFNHFAANACKLRARMSHLRLVSTREKNDEKTTRRTDPHAK
jgi:hypothetical protein